MLTLKEWLRTPEMRELKEYTQTELLTEKFFRDPFRRLYYNPNKMYSPADGVVLYAHDRIGPREKIVEVKGKNFTVQDLLYDYNYESDSLIVGVFMTIMDVHINRMPTNGYISETMETPFIYTHNTSMTPLELGLFYQEIGVTFNGNMNYLFKNEKLVTTVACPRIEGEYYVVQIADRDVNCIVNWGEGDFLQQGERFGMIRWGSQVDLVIPLDGLDEETDVKYNILAKPFHHVLGGVDALVEIEDLKDDQVQPAGV